MAHWVRLLAALAVCVALAQSSRDERSSDGAASAAPGRPGHLKPLGSHRPPEGDIDVLDYVPHPIEFHKNYVLASKPVLMKGATRGSRAFKLWNDAYLAENFGKLVVMTEHGKKENRSKGTSNIQLKTFLSRYNKTDEFMVETLPPPMRGDFQLLRSLLCGGFTNFLKDAVLWFSSGGTKSVLHYDNVENINCLMSGTKDLFLADKVHMDLAHIGADGAYSRADVDSVDMDEYPGLGQIPWWHARMEAGDCFYIPYRWLHQIRSFDRNLAINIWWVPMPRFHEGDCYVDGKVDGERKDLAQYSSLSNFDFTLGQSVRNELLERVKESKLKTVGKEEILEAVEGTIEAQTDEEAEQQLAERERAIDQLFSAADTNKDGGLDQDEVEEAPARLLVAVFGNDLEEGQGDQGDRKVMDYYGADHPEVEMDELDVAVADLPEGFEFPEDYDPETYDINEYLKAVEAEKQRKEEEAAAHTEL